MSGAWLYQSRYRVPVQAAPAGSLVLLEGLDASVLRTATVVPEFWRPPGGGAAAGEEDLCIFAPIQHDAEPVLKVAVEPLNPQDLPKMVEGLRKVSKSYPQAVTRVEESGEHTLFGLGELYLDSALKDLREVYGDVEVKVADPSISLCETVAETSSLKCFADTPSTLVNYTEMQPVGRPSLPPSGHPPPPSSPPRPAPPLARGLVPEDLGRRPRPRRSSVSPGAAGREPGRSWRRLRRPARARGAGVVGERSSGGEPQGCGQPATC